MGERANEATIPEEPTRGALNFEVQARAAMKMMADLTARTVAVDVDGGNPQVWWYVEILWTDERGDVRLRGHVAHSPSPKDAERRCRNECLLEHPDAILVEHFLTRRLTERKASSILSLMIAGDWDGWRF